MANSPARKSDLRNALLTLLLILFLQPVYAQDVVAPAFKLANAAGEQVSLPRAHEGVDIYLFWASWCPYCKALMLPHLQSMRLEYGDDVTIYALNIRDDEPPELFMSERGYDFILIPEADSIMELYGVRPTPALFLVDGKGMIRFNLYDMIIADSSDFKALSHGVKAGHRAPYWSAEIRQEIDQILAETSDD